MLPNNSSRVAPSEGLYVHDEAPGPKTPEPSTHGNDLPLPSPSRPRLRVKKRHPSHHLNAPTQQFLASVAAADVPIPSIEADIATVNDEEIINTLPKLQEDGLDDMDIYQHLRAQTFSPPKTPAIESAQSHYTTKYPDWSIDSEWSCSDIESSPEYESSRPSTAFSTHTSASLFSQYSHASEDGECISPELEALEFPDPGERADAGVPRKERPRKAPWTKAMSSHLWSTYLLYLQDPRVTPVRLGRSRIPPNGVCSRVAREARRSWKGSKGHLATDTKSGSSTPTVESSQPYIKWPHTCAATRARLRELCRLKAASSPRKYMSPSPAPFHKPAQRRRNRFSTPVRSPSVFSGQDMAFSLALSTSETMQLEGPLAQLTRSENKPSPEFTTDTKLDTAARGELSPVELPRLPSPPPIMAKSYGPSSSSSLAAGINLPRQSNTLGSRKTLKSPVRLTRSRSGTQKRRSVKSLEDLPRKRPSLSSAFEKESASSSDSHAQHQHSELSFALDLTAGDKSNDPFARRTPCDEPPFLPFASSLMTPMPPPPPPPRLGSPFSGAGSSYSFPNRMSTPIDFNLTALHRPFATVQQSTQTSSEIPSPPRSTLASRLAYLDQRLKELRNRSSDRRRSQSPL
ncbi:hypothetical protein AAE478_002420 [Parahypoxylon ruwenzoriense]